MKPTSDQMGRMLKLNFTRDLVKISFEEDNDVVVLNETELRLLDTAALKRIVEAVAILADDVTLIVSGSPAALPASDLNIPPEKDGLASLSLLQGKATVRYDSAQWKMNPTDESGIFQFNYLPGDLWARVISERLVIPLERMPDVALTNVKSEDPNAKIVKRGMRNVNGLRALYLEIEATIQGIPFTYYGHYYSGQLGTIQIVGWTGRSLMEEFRRTIERFVSGFEVPEK